MNPMANAQSLVADFSDPAETSRWAAVHDRVMGGVSEGGLAFDTAGFARFTGVVSLDFGGGFASVRRSPADLGLAGAEALRIRVRGDGKTYQLRLRPGNRLDGVTWQSSFAPGEDWMDVVLPLADFNPVFRGRPVPEAGTLERAAARQVGLLIAGKQSGPFRLEIRSIEALSAAER
jgi:hypothetical protein